MKKDQSSIIFGAIVVFIAVVYSIILFAVKGDFTTASWIIYGFTIFAFLALILDSYIPHQCGVRYPMLDVPLSVATNVFFFIQFICGGVIAMFLVAPDPTVTMIVEVIWLALYILAAFVFRVTQEIVQTQDENDSAKVIALRMMKTDLDVIASEVEDAVLKKSIANLAEAVSYSDPLSSQDLKESEERIKSNIAMLREEVDEGDSEKAKKRVDKIRRLLEDRNAKCAALKT